MPQIRRLQSIKRGILSLRQIRRKDRNPYLKTRMTDLLVPQIEEKQAAIASYEAEAQEQLAVLGLED